MPRGRWIGVLIWGVLVCAVIVPVVIAAASPLQAFRSIVYVIAGLSGVTALSLMLVQPLLAAGYLPGIRVPQGRRWHRWIGAALVVCVALHIGGLYLTSPPDTLDALLLVSPTPFSVYGVIGLWSLVFTAVFVAMRTRLGLRPGTWRIVHNVLASVVVVSSVVHALMIEGTMGAQSKVILCAGVLLATAIVVVHLRVIRPMRRTR